MRFNLGSADVIGSVEKLNKRIDTEDKKYIFRITSGNTPFDFGSCSVERGFDDNGDVYVTPVLYTWICHWRKNRTDKIFVLERPKLDPNMPCCGLNSHWFFCYRRHPELLDTMNKALLTKDFSDKKLQAMFKEHEERVFKRFGKKLSALKGGLYLGTLKEFDKNRTKDAYPQLILKMADIRNCKYEELVPNKTGTQFTGKVSKKLFLLEQEVPEGKKSDQQ